MNSTEALHARLQLLLQRVVTRTSGEPRFLTLTPADRILFLQRLALYLRSGVPILEAVHLLHAEATRPNTTYIYESLTVNIAQGKPLSHALEKFPQFFPTLVAELIGIGEASGRLHEFLSQAQLLLSERMRLRRRIIAALIYPALIGISTIGVAAFLALYAFPKMLPILRGFKTTLPLSTRLLIGIDGALQAYGWYVLGLMLLAVISLTIVSKQPRVQTYMDHVLLSLPLVRRLRTLYTLTLLARTLESLLHSGVRIIPTIGLCIRSTTSPTYRAALEIVGERVSEGGTISGALSAHPTLFPSYFIQLIASGERTGTLPENLAAIREITSTELSELTENLATLVEPLLMILMGLMVGFVALAIITPIYGITQNLTIH